MELAPGTILAGKFRCERALGEGSTGRVVEATHVVLGQRVAVKVLDRVASPSEGQRFMRAARLAFRLESAHVAKVLDAGELEDGSRYVAMELLEGVDLATLSRERGPLPPSEACSYVVQACAGLAEAHALGMVHRDVKLANLFLARTPKGSIVKVLDFGYAKAERRGETSIAQATRPGAIVGTPNNMAPEQFASSREVDARADVWSLGVALYTLLAGRPPFDGDALNSLHRQITSAPVPPIPRALPSGLLEVLGRCMRKRPEERFANASELAIALAPYARAPSRPKNVAVPAMAVAAAFAVLVLFVALRHAPREEAPPPVVEPTVARVPSASASPSVEAAPSAVIEAPSSSASSRVPVSAALPPVLFKLDMDHLSKGLDASDTTQPDLASMRAGVWCAIAFTKECYAELPECESQVTKIAFACRADASPDACTSAGAARHFARYRVATDKCNASK